MTNVRFALLIAAMLIAAIPAAGQTKGPARKADRPPHQWVNTPQSLPTGVLHRTFRSPSMQVDVGYCIYLPPDYEADAAKRYGVVYWLHGGNGNELTGIHTVAPIADKAIRAGELPPVIIVFVNGGPFWHYDFPGDKQRGETAFIRELIPHVDATYRTVADRSHRAIEGVSMGGRATIRNMFKYPELFCSAAPIAAGIQNEQSAIDSGMHRDNNVFLNARKYAANPTPALRIFLIVGTKDQNHDSNLAYMKLLDELKVPYEKLILEGVSHSNREYYDRLGAATLKFHARNFGLLP